jgi:hypothetical protein
MKFTDGYWLYRKGFSALHPRPETGQGPLLAPGRNQGRAQGHRTQERRVQGKEQAPRLDPILCRAPSGWKSSAASRMLLAGYRPPAVPSP